jgi:hypothetical protein
MLSLLSSSELLSPVTLSLNTHSCTLFSKLLNC